MTTFPVTASTLSEKDLGRFIMEKYDLNEHFECKLFRTGVNHTYFISDPNTRYVVRVYCHKWRTKTEIQEELRLLNTLKNNNLSVSFPIADKNDELIHEINAPEGIRYVVLFSFADGGKKRLLTNKNCFSIGSLIAKIHNITAGEKIARIHYDSEILLRKPYDLLKQYFSEDLNEMKLLRQIVEKISKSFQENNFKLSQKGIVHLDIWYDNLSVNNENDITIFDFDNCGNGLLILDLAYFCKQLFFIEQDKNQYESKVKSFLEGYRESRELLDEDLELIPEAGASIFIYYLGIQAHRFDWSNIFLTENYLKMFVGRIMDWCNYHTIEKS